jgi:acetyl-CoA carboxylase biotin carboxylase subunit
MEMNTRIQVEHPVTEQITEVDLIAEQIKSAYGHKLALQQKDICFRNHCIECRINAEDPKTSMPSPGKIDHYHRAGGLGVRIDDFIYSGYSITPFYDSMIAKVIVTAKTRPECIERMKRALKEMIVSGIKTNIETHLKILESEPFISGNFNTNLYTEIIEG